MSRDWIEAIGNAPIMFWTCPVPSHRNQPGELRVSVQWEGRVAHCTTPGCGRTSADPSSARLIRPCLAHAQEVNEWTEGGMHNHGLGLADECADCLTTDPATGEWVTCPSTAEPR